MFFESPEFKKSVEKDKKILEEGKIKWGDQFDELNKEVQRCKEWASRPDSFYDTEEKLKNPNYKKNGTREMWLQRLEEAERKLSELMISISNINSERLEAIANEIKDWDSSKADCEREFPWSDVALCILKYPQHVKLDFNTCHKCGKKRVNLHFSSPSWTWDMMCGSAGDMVICLECRSQDFNCMIMS